MGFIFELGKNALTIDSKQIIATAPETNNDVDNFVSYCQPLYSIGGTLELRNPKSYLEVSRNSCSDFGVKH